MSLLNEFQVKLDAQSLVSHSYVTSHFQRAFAIYLTNLGLLFHAFHVLMASKVPTQTQQGVTKALSGSNAQFNDKVDI